MAPRTKDSGGKTWLMAKASSIMQTVIFTKVSGLRTKQAVMEFILMSTEQGMKASGRKTSKTVKAENYGLMAQSTTANTKTA